MKTLTKAIGLDRRLDVNIAIHGSPKYFHLTGYVYQHGQFRQGGCIHDTILQHFPRLKPVADLHMCDMNGAPPHAVEVGWCLYQKREEAVLSHHLRLDARTIPEGLSKLSFTRLVELEYPRWRKEASDVLDLIRGLP